MIGLKLPLFVLAWAGMLAIKIPTILLGLIVVPVLWRYRATHYDELPWWAIPWANPEDWHGKRSDEINSLPPWWVKREGVSLWSWFKYHAIRNPANGLRAVEWLDLDIESKKVRYLGHLWKPPLYYGPTYIRRQGRKSVWYLAWQGLKAGFLYQRVWNDERHMEIKIGWRVTPVDALPREQQPNPDGQHFELHRDDAGFATKFLPWRKG